MKRILRHPATYLFLLQAALSFVGFRFVFLDGEQYMYVDTFDGLKNYFTYYAYLHQDPAEDPTLFTAFNYPYGDYLFYTDNTPAFSYPLKWFSDHVLDVKPHAFFLFNLFVALGVLLTTFFLYKILNLLIRSQFLIFVFSICLPWIHPQMLRIFTAGHFNLSLAWPILWVIYLLLTTYQHYERYERLPYARLVTMCLLLVVFTFVHVYYLLILAMLIGGFFLFWTLRDRRKKLGEFVKLNAVGLGVCLIGLAISMLIITGVDEYYELRKAAAEGYDYSEWKLYFSALFSHYHFNTIKFPVSFIGSVPYESYAYLGNAALYGALVFLALRIGLGHRLFDRFQDEQSKMLGLLLLTAGMSLFVSLGEVYNYPEAGLKFYNYLNPLKYLHKITDRVEQFRCLSRFSWGFFWAFNIGILFVLDRYLEKAGKYWFVPILCMLLLVVADARDFVRVMNGHRKVNILVDDQKVGEMRELAKLVDASTYQAVIPLPYYHVGSENYDYTIDIDPGGWWFTQTLQFHLQTGLPLMSSSMSRTAENQAIELSSMFIGDSISSALAEKLNDQPILVLVNENLFEHWPEERKTNRQPARQIFDAGQTFADEKQLQLVGEWKHFKLYEWKLN